MAICKICGKDSFWTVDLASKICEECKIKKRSGINESEIRKEKEQLSQKNKDNLKMKNSIETPNDYPMMVFISKFFDVLAVINIVIGIIVFVVQASDGNLLFGLFSLAISVISYGVWKLLSEVAKILSDIANNVKLIRSNSDYLATK